MINSMSLWMIEDFIYKQLTGVFTQKATRLGGGGPKLLQIAIFVIVEPITKIVILHITTGK